MLSQFEEPACRKFSAFEVHLLKFAVQSILSQKQSAKIFEIIRTPVHRSETKSSYILKALTAFEIRELDGRPVCYSPSMSVLSSVFEGSVPSIHLRLPS